MAEAKPKILIVEDDLDVAEMLNAYFRVQGYEVFTVNWGEDGVRAGQTIFPDLIILDIRLPDIDGYEVARRLRGDRRTNEIPIIFLTEKRERIDRLQGFEVGADDYITKPFELRELIARLRAALRRAYGHLAEGGQSRLNVGDLSLDLTLQRIMRGQTEIYLTATEFRLLAFLAHHLDQPFNREQLIEQVWGYDEFVGDARTVDVHIRNLRQKIEPDPSRPRYILTLRGSGYKLNPTP